MHPPKEGGPRVVTGRTGRAMALVGGLPQTADQPSALAEAALHRDQSARQCVTAEWEGDTEVHTIGRGGVCEEQGTESVWSTPLEGAGGQKQLRK